MDSTGNATSREPDDLVDAARERLQELEQDDSDEVDWGERIELAPGESFRGRYRGETTGQSKGGDDFTLYLFWDGAGRHRFMFRTTRLERELDSLKPNIGDEIAVARGTDKPSTDPDRSPTQRFAVRVRPSSEPLPGAAKQSAGDDDIPF